MKFVNISSDASSPNEMHEVSSASNSKSILEVEEETTASQIINVDMVVWLLALCKYNGLAAPRLSLYNV